MRVHYHTGVGTGMEEGMGMEDRSRYRFAKCITFLSPIKYINELKEEII